MKDDGDGSWDGSDRGLGNGRLKQIFESRIVKLVISLFFELDYLVYEGIDFCFVYC